MAKIPFIGSGYIGRSTSFESSRSVNLYPELSTDPSGKDVAALIGTPGTELFSELGTSTVRSFHAFAGLLFVVAANTLYSVNGDGTLINMLGTLQTSSGPVSMSDNGQASQGVGGDQLMIVDGLGGYIYNVTDKIFTTLSTIAAVQAVATLTIASNTVQSVALLNTGSGYTSAPTAVILDANVFANPGAPVTQTISVTTANSGLWKTTVTGPGTVTTSAGTATATGYGVASAGSPNTVTVTGNGTVVFTVAGTNATTMVYVTNAGTGTGATVQVNVGHPIASLNLNYSGTNSGNPIITITDPTGTGAAAVINPHVITQSPYFYYTADMTSNGHGYTNPTVTVVNFPGATLSANLNMAAFDIINVKLLTGGSNYATPQVAFSSSGGSGAVASAASSTKTITAINVTTGGSGYISAPIITISGTGGTTTPTAVVNNTSISSITFTGGTGYTGADPTISISAPEGLSIPLTPKQITYIDGYFVLTNGTMNHYVSDLYDGTKFNPIATSPVSAATDTIQAPFNLHQQLWFIKQDSTEVWQDTGNPTSQGSPFSRVGGAVIDYGTPAPYSVTRGDNSLFFLANQRTDGGGVFVGVAELNGYTPAIVSPPSITYQMSLWADMANAFGFCYSDGGHTFVQFTSPGDNQTFVYDTTTRMWHERSSYVSGSFLIGRHLANCYSFFSGKHLIGDYLTGKIYRMGSDLYTENGNPIIGIRTAPIVSDKQDRNNIFISRLTIDVEAGLGGQGTDPQASLAWSNDGGHTWSNDHPRSMGKAGEYLKRMVWRCLGYSRDRVFRLTMSSPSKRVIMGAYVEAGE